MAADRMGVNEAWSAEAWGMDAIVPLAYLAAKTENIIGYRHNANQLSGTLHDGDDGQSLDTVSNGRFNMGLGVVAPKWLKDCTARPLLNRCRECGNVWPFCEWL